LSDNSTLQYQPLVFYWFSTGFFLSKTIVLCLDLTLTPA
jgi:hypothetical protein